MLWLAKTAFSVSISLKKTVIANPVHKIPRIVALIILENVIFEKIRLIGSFCERKYINIVGIQIIVATAMEQNASSMDDWFFKVFTQFAEKA